MKYILLLSLIVVSASLVAGQECQQDKPDPNSDSFVCVCDNTYCDYPGPRPNPTGLEYVIISSSRDSLRFNQATRFEEFVQTGSILITVAHDDTTGQSMMGFGGSFTDSAAINYQLLSPECRTHFMNSYFSENGIAYSMGRVPIAGSDFSTYPYSYDDNYDANGVPVPDPDLRNWNLTSEDWDLKIPMIKEAMALNPNLLMMASPWAPPPWMKDNGMHNGSGIMLPEYYQPWANYFVKFLDAYNAEGVPIWGITPQNEPMTGFDNHPWNTCGWTSQDMTTWIRDNMGPTFRDNGYSDVIVMVLDHNRDFLEEYPITIFGDAEANQYVHGTAVHWYYDDVMGPEPLKALHDAYPDKFILYTESCEGWKADASEKVSLGNWQRAENYAYNILEDINHYSTGWIDWNLILDERGGPNWVSNYVDSPIIIDRANPNQFYKQPLFYAMGHFSKYVFWGMEKLAVDIQPEGSPVYAAAFHGQVGEETVIILNTSEEEQSVSIEAHNGTYVNEVLPPKSLHTIIYHHDD